MNKKITFIGCLHIFFFFSCSAQISGYLGKRLIISTHVNSMIAISGPTASNRGIFKLYEEEQKSSFALSNRFSLEGEYVVSRSSSISLGVSYYKTGMALKVTTPSLTGGNNSTDAHSLFYNLSATGISIGFSKYQLHKGAIPPLGKYLRFSIWANTVNGAILDKKTSFNSSNIKQHDKININPKRFQFGIGLGTQENYIYLDKLVLNVGWEIRLPYSLISYLNQPSTSSSDDYNNQLKYNNSSDFRLLYHDLFTMKIGFGYLAF